MARASRLNGAPERKEVFMSWLCGRQGGSKVAFEAHRDHCLLRSGRRPTASIRREESCTKNPSRQVPSVNRFIFRSAIQFYQRRVECVGSAVMRGIFDLDN